MDYLNEQERAFKGVWIPASIWLNEDMTITADEGFYIRSVTVKAVSFKDGETGGTDENDNDGTTNGD